MGHFTHFFQIAKTAAAHLKRATLDFVDTFMITLDVAGMDLDIDTGYSQGDTIKSGLLLVEG